MAEMMQEFIKESGITMEVVAGGITPEDFKDSDPWICTLTCDGRTWQVPYFTGTGHRKLIKQFSESDTRTIMAGRTVWAKEMQASYLKPVAPELEDVLDCLASDAMSYDNARDFDDWAADFGYDTDSRKAEGIYRAVGESAKKLRHLLGSEHYKTLLEDIERL